MKRRLFAWLHLCVARPLEGWAFLAVGRSPMWCRRFTAWTSDRMFAAMIESFERKEFATW